MHTKIFHILIQQIAPRHILCDIKEKLSFCFQFGVDPNSKKSKNKTFGLILGLFVPSMHHANYVFSVSWTVTRQITSLLLQCNNLVFAGSVIFRFLFMENAFSIYYGNWLYYVLAKYATVIESILIEFIEKYRESSSFQVTAILIHKKKLRGNGRMSR